MGGIWRELKLQRDWAVPNPIRAATIEGSVSPHDLYVTFVFSKSVWRNSLKVGRCLSSGKIATDPAPFTKNKSG